MQYCKDHIGHECNPARLPLKSRHRQQISAVLERERERDREILEEAANVEAALQKVRADVAADHGTYAAPREEAVNTFNTVCDLSFFIYSQNF